MTGVSEASVSHVLGFDTVSDSPEPRDRKQVRGDVSRAVGCCLHPFSVSTKQKGGKPLMRLAQDFFLSHRGQHKTNRLLSEKAFAGSYSLTHTNQQVLRNGRS